MRVLFASIDNYEQISVAIRANFVASFQLRSFVDLFGVFSGISGVNISIKRLFLK
jgi:hypothetical protein